MKTYRVESGQFLKQSGWSLFASSLRKLVFVRVLHEVISGKVLMEKPLARDHFIPLHKAALRRPETVAYLPLRRINSGFSPSGVSGKHCRYKYDWTGQFGTTPLYAWFVSTIPPRVTVIVSWVKGQNGRLHSQCRVRYDDFRFPIAKLPLQK